MPHETICQQKREFVSTVFEFYKSEATDKKILEDLIEKGKKLAEVVNPTLARDARKRRKYDTIERNCIAGVMAEYCWRNWLNSEAQRTGMKVIAESAIFQSPDKHVDISIKYPDGTVSTVEVRSSFPYTGLENAICNVFDIIGWYVNPVKTKEIRKEYYVRVLYPFHQGRLNEKLAIEPFPVFLTGGASRQLLEQSPHSRNKEFVPYDDIDSMLSSQKGTYRVIEPIINANDTPQITERIFSRKP